MNIIVSDTNKLFGMFRAMILEQSDLSWSELANYIRAHTVFVSTFILDELYLITTRYNVPVQDSHIDMFVQLLWLQVYDSKLIIDPHYLLYVTDENDVQIIQDAVAIQATHILTSNTKDFIKDKILVDFNIKIVWSLGEI